LKIKYKKKLLYIIIDFLIMTDNIFDQQVNDGYDRRLIDDMAAWYADPNNFPNGLPLSWRMTWDYTFSRINGDQDRDVILKCINDGTINTYDQGYVYSGTLVARYNERQIEHSSDFFNDLSLYPVGLPESWRFYWLYLVEREWCRPVCDIIIEALKRNDLHNCYQDVAVIDEKKFCDDARSRWALIDSQQ
jgi:hypothetical protein